MTIQHKLRLVEEFDSPDTTLVVASFPGKTNRSIKDIDAVASYTDHFVGEFAKTQKAQGKRVIIFAQKIHGEEAWYKEHDVLVARVWNKGTPVAFIQILTNLLFFRKTTSLLVQFEFHQFGGSITTFFFPLFLFLLRSMKKTVNLVLHQVVTDITTLSGHLNLSAHGIETKLFGYALTWFYRICTPIPHTLIVHNAILKSRLETMTGRSDIVVIPHGLGATRTMLSKAYARKKLHIRSDEFILLTFGFMTWYKGTDWLVKAVAKSKKPHIRLIVAGGESPNLKGQRYYETFIQKIYKEAQGCKKITITGFVEDTDIRTYFAASDLVILPYRTLMSSSGPLAMTIAYQKPFLISTALGDYIHDLDFAKALAKYTCTKETICFPLHIAQFWQKVEHAKKRLFILSKVSAHLSASRSWERVAELFSKTIEESEVAVQKNSAILKRLPLSSYARTY